MIAQITRAYCEPHRHYHTLDHILYMIRKAYEWKIDLESGYGNDLLLAIWGHDVVYSPGAPDNEADSFKWLKNLYEFTIGENVHRAIMDTKDHIARCDLSKDLIDLDLAILAEPWSYVYEYEGGIDPEHGNTLFPYRSETPGPYQAYVAQVRKEFSMATDEQWATGRSAWINSVLKKVEDGGHLFYTKHGLAIEQNAIDNLRRELATYGGSNVQHNQ